MWIYCFNAEYSSFFYDSKQEGVKEEIYLHILFAYINSINKSGGTFFVGFIIEYLEKLNAIILIIYSSQPYNVVCEHQVFALRGSD